MDDLGRVVGQLITSSNTDSIDMKKVICLIYQIFGEQEESLRSVQNHISDRNAGYQSEIETMKEEQHIQKCIQPLIEQTKQMSIVITELKHENQRLREKMQLQETENKQASASSIRADLQNTRSQLHLLAEDIKRISTESNQNKTQIDAILETYNEKITMIKSIQNDQFEDIKGRQAKIIESLNNKDNNVHKLIEQNNELQRKEIDRLNTIIIDLKRRANAIPETFAEQMDKIIVSNDSVDVGPLIRGIFRDSRRLDGFNELLSEFRIQNNNCVKSVINVQKALNTTQHDLHDLMVTDKSLSEAIDLKCNFLHKNSKSQDKTCKSILHLLSLLNDAIIHIAKNTQTSMDSIHSVFTLLTTRVIPDFGDFSEAILEGGRLGDQINDVRVAFEGERDNFIKIPKSKILFHEVEEHQVEVIESDQELKEIEALAPSADNSLLQLSVEELRMKMNDLSAHFTKLEDRIGTFEEEVDTAVADKANAQEVDRIYNQFTKIVKKTNKKINQIGGENTKKIDLVEELDNDFVPSITRINVRRQETKIPDLKIPESRLSHNSTYQARKPTRTGRSVKTKTKPSKLAFTTVRSQMD